MAKPPLGTAPTSEGGEDECCVFTQRKIEVRYYLWRFKFPWCSLRVQGTFNSSACPGFRGSNWQILFPAELRWQRQQDVGFSFPVLTLRCRSLGHPAPLFLWCVRCLFLVDRWLTKCFGSSRMRDVVLICTEGSAVDVLAGFWVDFLFPWAAAWCGMVLGQGLALCWSFLRCPGICF